MPLFANLLSTLPWPLLDIVMNVVAGLGAIILTYGVFWEAERAKTRVYCCFGLFASLRGLDWQQIFSLAMAGLLLAVA